MNHSSYKWAVLVMWLALPTSAWTYWRVWDRLPARMAVHFNANWQPNGYTTPEGALRLGLGIMLVMLVIFTVATLTIFYLKPAAVWPALLISYVVVGFCWYGNYSILKFNLEAQAAHSELVGTNSPAQSDSLRFVIPSRARHSLSASSSGAASNSRFLALRDSERQRQPQVSQPHS